MKKTTLILTISILAGAADLMTGICLMLVPSFTLGMMKVEVDPASLVYIRYIGAFVFAVGSSYLAGILPAVRSSDWSPLRMVWLLTAWIRLVICLFTGINIMSGSLEPAWISVPLTDGFLALLQGGWLLLGTWPNREGGGVS